MTLFEKDIFEIKTLQDLEIGECFDVGLSDMAPKTTGIKSVDQDRSLALVENVFEHLHIFLKESIKSVEFIQPIMFTEEVETKWWEYAAFRAQRYFEG